MYNPYAYVETYTLTLLTQNVDSHRLTVRSLLYITVAIFCCTSVCARTGSLYVM